MKNIVILSGAGMSVESGLSTFRDEDGLWERNPVSEVATHEAWLRQPNHVNDFYNMLRAKMIEAQPNKGHKIVAELEKHFNVTVITQNVDNLHERAGSSKVIHLHGELLKVCSSNEPHNEEFIETLTKNNIKVEKNAKAKDGSLLRPYIVFFNEAVPMIEPAANECMKADIMIVIGTSLAVYPAAGLIRYVDNNAKIYLIDPNPTIKKSNKNIEIIEKGASEGMEELYKRLIKEG